MKIFIIIYLIIISVISLTAWGADNAWHSVTMNLIDRYGIKIDGQTLSLTADKRLAWDGKIEPTFRVIRPDDENRHRIHFLRGECSVEFYNYILNIAENSPERDVNTIYELEGIVPVAFFSIRTNENAKTLFQGIRKGYFELDVCAQITEMFFEDVERTGGLEERFKDDYLPMKTHIFKIIRSFQKTRAEVSKGSDKIVIIGNIINYRKLTDNKKLGMIVDIETNTKNITNYIKYSFDNLGADEEYIGVKFRQNADEDNKLSDLDLDGKSENTAFWNYLLDLFAKKDEKNSEQILKNKITLKNIPARKIEIPSTFPDYMNTLEKAKTLALEAFKKKYQNIKLPNTETELNIPTPTQFAYKIIKLEGNVEHFAFAGTEILQIEMFNDQNELVCAAWLNSDNKGLGPSTTPNSAKESSQNKESNFGKASTLEKGVGVDKTVSGKDDNLDEKGNLSKESSLLKDNNLNKAFLSKNGGLDKADNSNKEGNANKEGNSNKESGLDKDSNLNNESGLDKEVTLNKKSNLKKEKTPDEEHNIIKEIYALSELNSEPILFILPPVAVPLPPAPPPPPPYEPPVWDHEKYIREYYDKQKQKEEQNIKSHITSPVNSEPILFILPPVAVPLPPAPPPPPPMQPLTEQEYEEYLKKQSTKKNKN